jgi:DNA-binding winged helix-turn-helix (wHTH) protein
VDTSWQTDGCSERCRVFNVQFPGRYYSEPIACHDPGSHEAYGEHRLARMYLPLYGRPVRTGGLTIDGMRAIALIHGEVIALTAIELRLLCFLARNIGRLCPGPEILSAVWGPEYVPERGPRAVRRHDNSHILRTHMARLRAKLGTERELVMTHPGLGYRLIDRPPAEAAP